MEWRESVEGDVKQQPILLLPFAAKEALVQGQSQSIILKEGRFYDLFQDCIDDYHSIIGMVLMGDDGLLKDMPLCVIDDFSVEAGFRGKVTVHVTLQAVGRAKIYEFTQMKPTMMGLCREVEDSPLADVALANSLVDDIESTIHDIVLTQRYDEAVRLALETDTQVYNVASDSSSSVDSRSIADLTAASWALFACASDKSCLHKVIASTSLIDRLELGLKALLDEKYQASAVSPSNESGDSESSFQ